MARIEPGEEYYVWPEGDEFQYSEHSEHKFCYATSCDCHENQESVQQLGQAVTDGLASTNDADRIFRGRTV